MHTYAHQTVGEEKKQKNKNWSNRKIIKNSLKIICLYLAMYAKDDIQKL